MSLEETLKQLEKSVEELEEAALLLQKRRKAEVKELKSAVKTAREKLIQAVNLISPAQTYNDSEFVNYTKVAADYKEYGERTPRDQNIVDGGAGSNMSAAVPPTIESEVIDYEEEISSNNSSDSSSGSEYSAEDPVEDWLAEEGQTLKSLLTEWSERAGWRLIWNSNRNYTLTAGAMFRGRFADVSAALIRAFARARPAPIATFYKGNRVLVVETMEDENAYE